jgi:hypothetical protein
MVKYKIFRVVFIPGDGLHGINHADIHEIVCVLRERRREALMSLSWLGCRN